MPELPEVETIRRGLDVHLVGRRIEGVSEGPHAMRGPRGPPLSNAAGRTVTATRRHGKLLVLVLHDSFISIHLGMSGKLLFAARGEAARPHTHVVFALDNGQELRFVDPRRFGFVRWHRTSDNPLTTQAAGPDALSSDFDEAILRVGLKASRAPLKSFLLDQTKVAGVGNIYACEALWRAGLSPRRKACNTPSRRVGVLHDAIRGVLADALAVGGTSFNDYVDAIGRPGSFLTHVAVFQREGQPCPRCKSVIRRITQGQRSTFYCPKCQR